MRELYSGPVASILEAFRTCRMRSVRIASVWSRVALVTGSFMTSHMTAPTRNRRKTLSALQERSRAARIARGARQINCWLASDKLQQLERLQKEAGLKSRGDAIERLIEIAESVGALPATPPTETETLR